MRRSLLIPALLLAAGCESTAPRRALIGQWGATDALLVANPREVQVHLVCWSHVFDRPIVLEGSGDFSLPETSLGSGPSTISVRGHVAGDRLTLDETLIAADGTHEFTIELGRNQPSITTVFCGSL